ncbi:hypothetical protein VKT23_016095 [Stygiomarasmius scandens]|uniref:Uncharacterized protein n=1 Tax=Marasmiellus scandens TaxID=2682957 RepID=A0ABR1IVR5_9AGAR
MVLEREQEIDIAHDRVGEADITREYTSSTNPRFILHDSKGFESGSDKTWAIVENFIRNRCSAKSLKDRLHTIWLCIETPREGSRILEIGDQKLLKIANELRLPVVIVFTKYDLLFNAKYQEARRSGVSKDELSTTAEKNAAADLKKRLGEFRDNNINLKFVEWVKDSTDGRSNSRSNSRSVRWVKVSADSDANASTTNARSKPEFVSWVEVSMHPKYRNPDGISAPYDFNQD